jgi:hypothetical protein
MTDESPATPEPGQQPAAHRKYAGGDVMHHDGRHAWLRLVPDKVTSWDFRILYQAQK